MQCKNMASTADFLLWAIWPPRLFKDPEMPAWLGLTSSIIGDKRSDMYRKEKKYLTNTAKFPPGLSQGWKDLFHMKYLNVSLNILCYSSLEKVSEKIFLSSSRLYSGWKIEYPSQYVFDEAIMYIWFSLILASQLTIIWIVLSFGQHATSIYSFV